MSNLEKYENLVIGSGGAGKLMAWTMGGAGRRVALVERGALGGACPNVACLPSKNIIHAAKVISLAKRAEFGLKAASMSVDMAAVQRRKRLMVEGLQQMHLDRTTASHADLIRGSARFIAPRTVEIDLNAGGKRTIFGERVFLDLGSRASIPKLPGLAEAHPMTHVEFLDLDRLPEHLIVIGGGYVGLELAQAMRRFGAKVTVIEESPQLAVHEDPDIGAELKNLFADEGIEVLLEARIERVEGQSGNRVRVHMKDPRGERTIEGNDLLVATGRTANTGDIALEVAGVQLDAHGDIKVNDRLATTAENVWAMGDCAGSPHFTHVSENDFKIVYENLRGGNYTTKSRLIPFCMFTDPELARVGMNETEAKRAGIEYRLVQMPYRNILRTRTISEPRGLIKMLIARGSDQILGFTALGVEASELMSAVQTAMAGRLPYTILRDAIFTHPTMSEGLNVLLANVAD
ncbi:MAG TPA: FAD-dependent oxidoreductase [Candidatus Binataceae bacterium]|nr:FAD-dependent oxidoreductase [Candidatus Binataceae bacterium]